MKETSDSFVAWLLTQYDDPELRQNLSHTEIYGRLQNVEVGVSIKADAITQHEKYISLIEAGFTQDQAFKFVVSERSAIMAAAVTEQIRIQNGGKSDNPG